MLLNQWQIPTNSVCVTNISSLVDTSRNDNFEIMTAADDGLSVVQTSVDLMFSSRCKPSIMLL